MASAPYLSTASTCPSTSLCEPAALRAAESACRARADRSNSTNTRTMRARPSVSLARARPAAALERLNVDACNVSRGDRHPPARTQQSRLQGDGYMNQVSERNIRKRTSQDQQHTLPYAMYRTLEEDEQLIVSASARPRGVASWPFAVNDPRANTTARVLIPDVDRYTTSACRPRDTHTHTHTEHLSALLLILAVCT